MELHGGARMSTAYEPATALVVVDVQNDFADPSGSLYVRAGEEVVPFVNEEIRRAAEGGAMVAYTQDWHPPSTPHFQRDGGIWPVHCVAGTWGAEFLPGLEVNGETVRKGADGKDGYSGFSVRDPASRDVSATKLESILRAHGVERVVISGLATDYCVAETDIDARRLGIETVVLETGVRAVDLHPGDGARALARMREVGATIA
jgi:nicotinamidase/pyrazinamidase